jgi:hypothetical protein
MGPGHCQTAAWALARPSRKERSTPRRDGLLFLQKSMSNGKQETAKPHANSHEDDCTQLWSLHGLPDFLAPELPDTGLVWSAQHRAQGQPQGSPAQAMPAAPAFRPLNRGSESLVLRLQHLASKGLGKATSSCHHRNAGPQHDMCRAMEQSSRFPKLPASEGAGRSHCPHGKEAGLCQAQWTVIPLGPSTHQKPHQQRTSRPPPQPSATSTWEHVA